MVIVEGVGEGVSEQDLGHLGVLTRMNSELGSLMGERFNDARLAHCLNITQNHVI